MIRQYVQLQVVTNDFNRVKEKIANISGWYILTENQTQGLIGIVPTSDMSRTTPLSGIFLGKLKKFEEIIPQVFWITIHPNTKRIELNVYRYTKVNQYKEVEHEFGEKNLFGTDICEKVDSKYGVELQFDWEKFKNEYSFVREI